jgi:hypothetical protein
MARLTKLVLALTTLLLFSFATPAVNAVTVIIGNNNDLSRYPFGKDPGAASSAFPDFAAGGVYQQVYAGSAFSGPITITQIAFASKGQLTSGPGTATYNFNIALSTTAAGPNGLSTNLAANRGADFVQVFSGPLAATITANDQFDLIINIVPFTYNPANGNLLLDVAINSPTQFTAGPVLYYDAGFDSRTSRAANPGGTAGGAFTDGFGIETRFATAPPTAAPATISGQVTDANGVALPGVAMRVLGETSFTAMTDANGKYRFEALDAGNFYTVVPELANHRFLPTSRSFSLVGDETEAVFSALPDAVVSANAIDSNEYFVRQQYLDFLGREPDQHGFEYWSGQLNQCNADTDCLRQRRIDVSAAFFKSVEFEQTGLYIYRLYEGTLDRQPSYAEFTADRRRVVGGAGLDADKVAFASEFVARPEFVQKYEANLPTQSFVAALLLTLRNTTGVDLSSEKANLIALYNSGGTLSERRGRVVAEIAENPAFTDAVYNQAFVQMEYFGYLRREIDGGGYAFWLNVLNERDAGNYRGMVCSFITSTEYQRRFGTVVTRSNAECGR